MEGTAVTAEGLGCQGSGWSGNSASESQQLGRSGLSGPRLRRMSVRGPWSITERGEVPRKGTRETRGLQGMRWVRKSTQDLEEGRADTWACEESGSWVSSLC